MTHKHHDSKTYMAETTDKRAQEPYYFYATLTRIHNIMLQIGQPMYKACTQLTLMPQLFLTHLVK